MLIIIENMINQLTLAIVLAIPMSKANTFSCLTKSGGNIDDRDIILAETNIKGADTKVHTTIALAICREVTKYYINRRVIYHDEIY